MRSLKLFVILILFPFTIYSQSGWYPVYSGVTYSVLKNIYFVNDNTGFAVGHELILKTTDRGLNWIPKFVPNNNFTFNSVHSHNGLLVFAAGYGGSLGTLARIYESTDSGENWFLSYSSALYQSFISCIAFVNDSTGFFVGGNALYSQAYSGKTTNAGISWNSMVINSYVNLSEVLFVNQTTGFISGNGASFKSTNSGQNWFNGGGYGGPLSFIDENTGFECNFNGLRKTTDAGFTWTTIFNMQNIISNVYDICFVNNYTGYAVGYSSNSNRLIKTTNSGFNWYSQFDSTSGSFISIFFLDQNTGFACGSFNSDLIIKTTTGGVPIGIQHIGTNVPKDFSLSQNYPNPFNPVTKIRFDIGGTSSAQTLLSVYDLLGCEIKTLVNEKLRPGEFEVDFVASNYPSGIYYYKLTANDFTETKKMVLVK